MKGVPALGLIAAAFLAAACADEGNRSEDVAERAAPPRSAAPASPTPTVLGQDERMVVRNAELDLVVPDTRETADRIVRLADSLGGYASGLRGHRAGDLMRYQVVLRVPAPRFDGALRAIKALAIRVEREALRTEDVTEQVVDLEARLRTLRATEEELRALLAESRRRGSGAEEIMAVFRELTEIRTRIEQTQGQLETHRNRVALSTITVELSPEAGAAPLVGEDWRPGSTVRSAVRTLVGLLQGYVDLVIYVVIVLVPILVLFAVPILVLVLLVRRRGRKRPHSRQASP